MPWNKRQVLSALKNVDKHLAANPDGKRLALHVPEGGYRVDDEWLLVIIDPGVENVRADDYVWALVDVEKELRKDGLDHVTLVPAIVR